MAMQPDHLTSNERKALGAFYTPSGMADKIVAWAVREPRDVVVDPSFGGLVFLDAARRRLIELGASPQHVGRLLHGADLDSEAHAEATGRVSATLGRQLIQSDFFALSPGIDLPLASAVVGNPPYVRYQGFNKSGRVGHDLAQRAGVRLTRLASSWAPFVVHAAAFVAPGGRLALVLPAEALHAQYAAEVLEFLQRAFGSVTFVSFAERVFPGALEEVVLLLADERGSSARRSARLIDVPDLAGLNVEALNGAEHRDDGLKLISQLLPLETRDLYATLSAHRETRRLGETASVNIGAVTGANDFFLRKPGTLPERLTRFTVSRAIHIRGTRLTNDDKVQLVNEGASVCLFAPARDTDRDYLSTFREVLREGRIRQVNRRYKCRVRKPWWCVPIPTQGVPDAFLTYFSNAHPRLVANTAGALNTNTLHGVRFSDRDANPEAEATLFCNSLTLLSAELVGRSYGGGVLKLEPTEAEDLLLPPPAALDAASISTVDSLVRKGRLDAALDIVDELALERGLGLSRDDVLRLRTGAAQLRGRRRGRSRPPRR